MKKIFTVLLLGCCMSAITLGLTGCRSTVSSAEYFQNADQVLVGQKLPDYEIRVKPGDELRINVSSSMPEATAMYNLAPYVQNGQNHKRVETETRLTTYLVSPSGTITMPVLGDLKVLGMTSEEVKQLVVERVSENVKDPVVSVDFTDYVVTVLGEVGEPKRIVVSKQRFSVFDALGQAGDVMLTGKKTGVRLIREENGRATTHVLDLSDANIVNSPYYYMQQNDVLIVEAGEVAKQNAQYNQQNGFRLSVFSACISTLSVIASLVIALSR